MIRSTWDYTERRAEFLAWARSVPVLANSYRMLEWNSDKIYLRDLADAGMPITPTEWLAPGLGRIELGYDEFVVKPSIGAGSRGAGRFRAAHGGGRTRARRRRCTTRAAPCWSSPILAASTTPARPL